MDYNEKVKYIIKDYTENVINKIGIRKDGDEWFDKYLKLQSDFILKYKDNSMSQFAKRLSLAYGEVVDMSVRTSDRSNCSQK